MALERFAGREALRSREAAERDELFRRTALGAESISEIQPDGGEDAAIQGSIANSKRALEDAFAQGAAILTDMAAQRERLKATKRKVLDVLSSVGLSDSLLRMIDRRQRLDMIIVYGGMLLTLLLLIGLWWVFKA
uniref:V-snare-domain-containing protein n=2 Tax=Tetraselmis sp. GSL018 TaxID=582737 RepID=A0A061SM55_9CHLO|mmetsp:Transcript_3317/g.7813  ORF Transcript_3317/g.7813 Transcript_3317/m.7813 type:complete len:135 (+) Transcript_3317:755-1159(+)